MRDRLYWSPGLAVRPDVFKGGDEWGNPSLVVAGPLIGELTIFYGRGFDRSKWFHSGWTDYLAMYISPDYKRVAYITRSMLLVHQVPYCEHPEDEDDFILFQPLPEQDVQSWATQIEYINVLAEYGMPPTEEGDGDE